MQNGSDEMETPSASTALVALAAGCEARTAPMPRPLAGFVTQLLACRGQLPAYRSRRRAAPGTALASYGRTRTGMPAPGYERRF